MACTANQHPKPEAFACIAVWACFAYGASLRQSADVLPEVELFFAPSSLGFVALGLKSHGF